MKEAGSGRALINTDNGLRPNAEARLTISFARDVNCASVDAIEEKEDTN